MHALIRVSTGANQDMEPVTTEQESFISSDVDENADRVRQFYNKLALVHKENIINL